MANGVTIIGGQQLERLLKSLGERTQRKVLRPAINAAATPIVKAARSKVAVESGLLKKSLGKKVVTNKKRQTVTAIIGPRRGQGTYKGKLRKPSRYAHLVEKGFIDQHGNHHAPRPFLRPALDEQAETSVNAMRSKLASGIVKEAAKAGVS